MAIQETVTVEGLRCRAKWLRGEPTPRTDRGSLDSCARHLELAADRIEELEKAGAPLAGKPGLSEASNDTVQIIIEGIQDLGVHQRFADYATGRERDSGIDWQARIDALFKEIY